MPPTPGASSEAVDRARAECRRLLAGVRNVRDLQDAKGRTLGKSGILAELMSTLRAAPAEAKRELGAAINVLKGEVAAAIEEAEARLGAPATRAGPLPDVTLPGRIRRPGAVHPLTRIERHLVSILSGLGFEPTEGPAVEDEFHNFIALNIPEHHPARDEQDNFYLQGIPWLLRSQTSTVQIRTMEARKPPFRIQAPGRVFRPDTVDATHHFMFHQVEGLAVDRNLSMADLKTTLLIFFRALFGEDVELRLRPSFFPFTEPSAEVDVYFPGRGWVEAGGCGMVDPAVFESVGIDPEAWSGFAFGLGIERLAMRQFDVPDIRHFTENDVRFLRQLD